MTAIRIPTATVNRQVARRKAAIGGSGGSHDHRDAGTGQAEAGGDGANDAHDDVADRAEEDERPGQAGPHRGGRQAHPGIDDTRCRAHEDDESPPDRAKDPKDDGRLMLEEAQHPGRSSTDSPQRAEDGASDERHLRPKATASRRAAGGPRERATARRGRWRRTARAG